MVNGWHPVSRLHLAGAFGLSQSVQIAQPRREFILRALAGKTLLTPPILTMPQALGTDMWFATAVAPSHSTTTRAGVQPLKPQEADHETLAPICQTLRSLAEELPKQTVLIDFARAPWTVATHMIAGRCSKHHSAVHAFKAADRATLPALTDVITEATSGQWLAGAIRRVVDAFETCLNIFNFGLCITPDANPNNMALMVETVRAQ